MEEILKFLLGALVGFFIAVFAEPLRQKLFKPDLDVEFVNSPDYVALTPENRNCKAYYIRVKVSNRKRILARDCRAYLINIEKKDEKGKCLPTIYCDSIPLAWSLQKLGEQYSGIDIAKDVNQFVDIIKTTKTRNDANSFYPQIMVTPFRYENLFGETGTFRFTIQVSAANADPKNIKLIFDWEGVWDDFKVEKGVFNEVAGTQ
jgi:hypothetical protein